MEWDVTVVIDRITANRVALTCFTKGAQNLSMIGPTTQLDRLGWPV